MDQTNSAAAPLASSRTTSVKVLVAIWHFVVAAAALTGLVLMVKEFRESEDERFLIEVSVGLVISIAALYVATGIGILRWKSWSRIVALVLNWINLVCAALMLLRLQGSVTSIASALASCLVIWWLSMGPIKLQFRASK